jgi:hypothetical protein
MKVVPTKFRTYEYDLVITASDLPIFISESYVGNLRYSCSNIAKETRLVMSLIFLILPLRVWFRG